ncbi:MAG: mRNA interferase HigB, partial [Cellvibrionaceae bacterium]
MHIISRKALREFGETYPSAEAPLTRWYTIVRKSEYANFVDLRQPFLSADKVGNLIVFNIGG